MRLRIPRFTLLGAAGLMACTPLFAGTLNGLTSLTINGSLGSFSDRLTYEAPSYGTSYVLNTDNGALLAGGIAGNGYLEFSSGPLVYYSPQAVTQVGGPTVNVYDFSSFNLPQGYQLLTYGNAPAAILSQSSMTIAGPILSINDVKQGAYNVTAATGPGGGGNGGNGWGYVDANTYGTAGGGGGGGMFSQGGKGTAGVPQIINIGRDNAFLYAPDGGIGGAKLSNLDILSGGGGGGAGGTFSGSSGDRGSGGNGGGALFFGTPGNFTITSTGSISANGQNGLLDYSNGGSGVGGGGGGGYLWFDTGGVWTNDGLVSAAGGAGASGYLTTITNTTGGWVDDYYHGGAGSGGYVNIDPGQVINNGTIDVADGQGGSTYGGYVNLNGAPLSGTGQIEGSSVPEPSEFLLLFMALGAVVLIAWRRGN